MKVQGYLAVLTCRLLAFHLLAFHLLAIFFLLIFVIFFPTFSSLCFETLSIFVVVIVGVGQN